MTPMPLSPTEEIRRIRHELAAQFDNDLDHIFEDLCRKQAESGREIVAPPPRQPNPAKTADSTIAVPMATESTVVQRS
jgi:hypothetical protein